MRCSVLVQAVSSFVAKGGRLQSDVYPAVPVQDDGQKRRRSARGGGCGHGGRDWVAGCSILVNGMSSSVEGVTG